MGDSRPRLSAEQSEAGSCFAGPRTNRHKSLCRPPLFASEQPRPSTDKNFNITALE